jgi:cell division protein FtsW
VCGLIIVEDLGTAVLIGAVGIIVLIAAGARMWHVALMAPAGAAAAIAMIVWSPYRLRRITSFVDPWADPQGAGYHLVQSLNTIQEGGLIGRGLGNGIGKFGYVPEDTTDFIFAVICGELGIAGAMLVAGLYIGLLAAGYAVIREHGHAFGRLLALGVLVTVGLQALINMAVVTGLVPTKGIALPLVSNGGTGWVMTAMAIGLIVALDRINRLESRRTIDVAASECAEVREARQPHPLPMERPPLPVSHN